MNETTNWQMTKQGLKNRRTKWRKTKLRTGVRKTNERNLTEKEETNEQRINEQMKIESRLCSLLLLLRMYHFGIFLTWNIKWCNLSAMLSNQIVALQFLNGASGEFFRLAMVDILQNWWLCWILKLGKFLNWIDGFS